jgi:hypothetical protein
MIRSLTLLLVCATALLLTGGGCKKKPRADIRQPPAPGEYRPYSNSYSDFERPKDGDGPRSLKK